MQFHSQKPLNLTIYFGGLRYSFKRNLKANQESQHILHLRKGDDMNNMFHYLFHIGIILIFGSLFIILFIDRSIDRLVSIQINVTSIHQLLILQVFRPYLFMLPKKLLSCEITSRNK